ncbi:EAL domain-containing protein [Massilia sp. RP-1-19]|uniref:EAL domain-containing protein n=1 Tax=Massilia polaris TaxID=2728846 RepID=A0A848HU64_9BURK|nr:EAL domain-containing protein [Massilia polaris]NML63231.1 EAL domain-containing protein [Massilia polaris]
MIDTASPDNARAQVRVRDFYLGRQPILARDQSLFGYELLFRNAPVGPASIDSDLSATAAVIAHAAQLGMNRVLGDACGFLNVDAAILTSDIFAFLPREKLVLEIVEAMQPTQPLLDRIAELAGHGFRFALSDVVAETPALGKLLPMMDYLKLSLRNISQPDLQRLVPALKASGKKLVAEKVETREEFDCCKALGFDYFQGFYFARPAIISGRKLSPGQLALLELMKLIAADADNIVIERAVKKDVTLALNLLRLVNTPAVGAGHRIDSVSQAVTILGRRQLQRWLQIMLYAEPARRGESMPPLLTLATARGRLLELLAQRLRPGQRRVPDIAFTVGIMSLMDALFGMPMNEIVEQIPVSAEVAEALLKRTGFFGELLRLAERIEMMDESEEEVAPALAELALSADDLGELEVAAFEWCDSVARYAI